MSTTRVLIADDHEAVRRGLRSVLEGNSELKVIGEAVNGEEAVEQVQRLKPDLVILDLSMPILDGLAAAREIKKFSPGTPIVVFSMHKIKEFVDIAKRIGLRGFVAKEDDGNALLEAVDAVLHDRTYFPS
jgi:two-component system nitrate/nitrite response regulator NarL